MVTWYAWFGRLKLLVSYDGLDNNIGESAGWWLDMLLVIKGFGYWSCLCDLVVVVVIDVGGGD